MQKSDGMNYAPVSQAKTRIVCKKNEFLFAVIGLDHGHIYGMCNGLLEAGATLAGVYDPDPKKIAEFLEKFPGTVVSDSREALLNNPQIRLIASGIVPYKRASLGIEVMEGGKDYFVDKPGMLTMDELDRVEACCRKTENRYFIYFSERIHVEGALFVQKLLEDGAVGDVVQIAILAPHRINRLSRQDWFFEKDQNGGIITDIGSHQVEQFLTFSGGKTASVLHSFVNNYNNTDKPNFFDFGDVNLLSNNSVSGYFRVDWFTPDGLGSWGDGRVFITGTKGTIELRKYLDVAASKEGDNVILVNGSGEYRYQVTGKVGFFYFGNLILDCINRTETAIAQRHTFEAMRITIQAQMKAEENSYYNFAPKNKKI